MAKTVNRSAFPPTFSSPTPPPFHRSLSSIHNLVQRCSFSGYFTILRNLQRIPASQDPYLSFNLFTLTHGQCRDANFEISATSQLSFVVIDFWARKPRVASKFHLLPHTETKQAWPTSRAIQPPSLRAVARGGGNRLKRQFLFWPLVVLSELKLILRKM